jgi:antitoxin (DNA-binding transcriptional repressor) of toxin-antitoxin stability system
MTQKRLSRITIIFSPDTNTAVLPSRPRPLSLIQHLINLLYVLKQSEAVERLELLEQARFELVDKPLLRRYKVFMKTLTITEAKKNLGRWLAAAARGEDIGIVCGADIVALRKVAVESTDYARREYGATSEQVAALEKATEQRYRRLKRSKKLAAITAQELRKMLE